MPESFVKSFTHLKGRFMEDRALPMLQRIASLVKPIMRKHGWTLPVLAEFFPESPNLLGLNINSGQKICLRLRPAQAPDTFYEEDDVVQTMLHELTHNVHGPHDEKFYKFLSGLQEEYDTLRRSGYAGEGFFSKGQRVGVNVSHDPPSYLARAKALEAAEKRRQTARTLGSGGRVGGRVANTQSMSPRELAAQAAERRARDEKACGSGDLAIQEAEKAAKESIKDVVIDLTMDNSDSDSDIVKESASDPPTRVPKTKGVGLTSSRNNAVLPSKMPIPEIVDHGAQLPMPLGESGSRARPEWSCTVCTLLNSSLVLQCGACLTERPPNRSTGWTCLVCRETEMPPDHWSCGFCGTVKSS